MIVFRGVLLFRVQINSKKHNYGDFKTARFRLGHQCVLWCHPRSWLQSQHKDDTIQVRHNLVCQEVLIAGMVITDTQQCFKNTEDVLKILTLGGSYQLAFSLNIVSQNVWQRWVTCHQTHFITQSKRGELVSAREQSFCGHQTPHGSEISGGSTHICAKFSRQSRVKNEAIWVFIPAL